VHFVKRVGMDYVRKRVVEDERSRKELCARLRFALAGYADPWAERAQGAERERFEAIPA
jgi:nitrite reductase (NADH) large subunit